MRPSDYIPPIVTRLFQRLKLSKDSLYYFGDFEDWKSAELLASKYGKSYAEEGILARVAKSSEIVRRGEALYEQDGVLYYEERYIYELLSALYYILLKEPKMILCDFGGALGSTYYRYREKLPIDRLKWNIVEQKHFVDYGNNNIPEFEFYYSIETCHEENPHMNTVLMLSVLAYLENPYEMLDRILMLENIKYLVIDETVFNIHVEEKEHIVLQHVPPSIYSATYPSHIFNQSKFKIYIERKGFKKVFEWVYPGGSIPIKERFGIKSTINKGFLFERNTQ